MEEQNVNNTNTQGGDLSNFKEAFSNYQKKQVKTPRISKEDKLAKYFTARKPEETFRILPYKTKFFYIEAFFHVISLTSAGGKKRFSKVYCPAHNDPKIQKVVDGVPQLDGNGKPLMVPAPCALCARAKKILATQNPSLKNKKKDDLSAQELVIWENNRKIFMDAGNWDAKKFYIIRGIDKDKTGDGVKYWRFKHNFKNQGTLDKLFPILDKYNTQNGTSFADPTNGADLSINTVDSQMPNGLPYKSIIAIATNNKSLLHTDPIVVRQWLEDKTTWRDIFKPKTAPGITTFQFLELIATGENPYWEDSDASNKHWVFPGHPDLETAANTRTRNLDSDGDADIEMASDLEEVNNQPRVTISNVTPQNVGTYPEEHNDITAKTNVPVLVAEDEHDDLASNEDEESTDYSDLPF